MTTKHLALGLMYATKARNHAQCEAKLGLAQAQMHHWYHQPQRDMRVSILFQLHDKSGLAIDTLVDWLRQPEGAAVQFSRAPQQQPQPQHP